MIVLRVSVQSNLQFDCLEYKQLQIRPNYLSVQTHWAVRCYLCAQAGVGHLRLQVSKRQEKCEFYCSEIRAKSINADFFPKKRVFEAFC